MFLIPWLLALAGLVGGAPGLLRYSFYGLLFIAFCAFGLIGGYGVVALMVITFMFRKQLATYWIYLFPTASVRYESSQ